MPDDIVDRLRNFGDISDDQEALILKEITDLTTRLKTAEQERESLTTQAVGRERIIADLEARLSAAQGALDRIVTTYEAREPIDAWPPMVFAIKKAKDALATLPPTTPREGMI